MRTVPALERCLHAAEQADRLDAPGYQLEHALKLGFLLFGRRSRALQDLLHGVWLGHPLHPVLVTVPIGSWTVALLLDLLDATGRGGPGARQAAHLATGLGAAGAVAAAGAGLADWQHSHDEARRVGVVHATLNTAALGLYAWSLADRAGDRAGRARMTALAGYTITTASSWLGGALAYRYRLGADHSDPRVGPRRYTSVADLLDLPEGEPCGVEVDGLPVVLLRAGDVVHAVGGNCPHLGAPLAQGWTYRGSLVCPWHGSRFDPATGDVVQGPATHPLPCFDVRTDGGPRRAAPPGALALAHRIDDAQGGQPVKADEVLVEHHRVLLGLLDRLERTPDPVLRRQLLDAFVVELTIHTQIEDEVLYPAVRDVSPLLSVAHAEHRQIDEQLAVVLGTDVGGDELPVEVRMLTRTLAHHVDEEELHMLPQARALGEARLEELGGQLRQRQRELDRSAVAGAIARVKRSVLRRV